MSEQQELQKLPLFKDTRASDRCDLFIKKLRQCCMLYNFGPNNATDKKSKEMKEQTLYELSEYILKYGGVVTKCVIPEIMNMFKCNVFQHNFRQCLEPRREGFGKEAKWEADIHLLLVYEFFLLFLELPDFNPRQAKLYIDEDFVKEFLALFNSKDRNERELAKRILHKIYSRLYGLQDFIQKEINIIFHVFVYETESYNGIRELLEVVGSIIHGFSVPLKKVHKVFLLKGIMSLHKVKSIECYHEQLIVCIENFLIKDPSLTESVVNGLLKVWPKLNTGKELLFLKELQEILNGIEFAIFPKIMVPVFRQLAKCASSPHCHVAIDALEYWNNEYIMGLVYEHVEVLLPIMFPVLHKRFHWHRGVNGMIYNACRVFMGMNRRLFDRCVRTYELARLHNERIVQVRHSAWSRIETLASQNAQRMSESTSGNLPTPVVGKLNNENTEKPVTEEEEAGRKRHTGIHF